MNNTPGDIIILHKCTKNNDQPQKSKFYKKEKKPGDIIILHMYTKNYDHMMYAS